MTTMNLKKLCVVAGVAFGVSACNSSEKEGKLLDLAIAKTHSKSLLDQGVGQAMAEEVSTSAARIGRDVRAVAIGEQFAKCKATRQTINGESVVVFGGQSCLLVSSRAEAANSNPAHAPKAF